MSSRSESGGKRKMRILLFAGLLAIGLSLLFQIASAQQIQMNEHLSKYLHMTNERFTTYYYQNALYKNSIVYDDADDWQTPSKPVCHPLRFYEAQKEPILCHVNIGSTKEDAVRNFGEPVYQNDNLRMLGFQKNSLYITVQFGKSEDSVVKLSVIREPQNLPDSECAPLEADEFVFGQIETGRLLREELLANSDWVAPPDGTKTAACLIGMRPIDDSAIYLRFQNNAYPPYSFRTVHGCSKISWLNNRYFIYKVYNSFPYLYDTKTNTNQCILSEEEYGQRGYYDDRDYRIIGNTIETVSRTLEESISFAFSFDGDGTITISRTG